MTNFKGHLEIDFLTKLLKFILTMNAYQCFINLLLISDILKLLNCRPN